jgi:hypothetical protein
MGENDPSPILPFLIAGASFLSSDHGSAKFPNRSPGEGAFTESRRPQLFHEASESFQWEFQDPTDGGTNLVAFFRP